MKVLCHFWFVTVFCMAVALCSGHSFSYPENSRYGYSSCQSCHLSPTGGGALTPYGRATASEIMGALSYDGAGELAYGLGRLPNWLLVGGDTRFYHLKSERDSRVRFRRMLMQSDIEIAVQISNKIALATSAGYYGLDLPITIDRDPDLDFRRQYILMRPKSGWTVRVGRYMPGYGLMIADHTTNIRGGLFWPQGAESENLEVGYMDRAGEILATYLQRRDGSEAIIGRASKFVGSSSQLGLSVFSSDDAKSAGLFAMIGFSKSFWAMAEVDYKLAEKPLIVEFEQIGVEILSGIMALGTRQATYFPHDENIYKHGFGLQIFPFPHFEFLTAVDRTIEGDQKTTTCSLLSHYYL